MIATEETMVLFVICIVETETRKINNTVFFLQINIGTYLCEVDSRHSLNEWRLLPTPLAQVPKV